MDSIGKIYSGESWILIGHNSRLPSKPLRKSFNIFIMLIHASMKNFQMRYCMSLYNTSSKAPMLLGVKSIEFDKTFMLGYIFLKKLFPNWMGPDVFCFFKHCDRVKALSIIFLLDQWQKLCGQLSIILSKRAIRLISRLEHWTNKMQARFLQFGTKLVLRTHITEFWNLSFFTEFLNRYAMIQS